MHTKKYRGMEVYFASPWRTASKKIQRGLKFCIKKLEFKYKNKDLS
jgi:hypothetical protein